MSNWPHLSVNIKLLRPTARVPVYGTGGAAGADVFADIEHRQGKPFEQLRDGIILPFQNARTGWFQIYRGECVAVPLGLAFEIPIGWHAMVKGRSSSNGEGLIDHVGTIDADYRGEAHVIFHATRAMTLKHGDRLGQLVFVPTGRALFSVVDQLSPTERGEAGFGSTGR